MTDPIERRDAHLVLEDGTIIAGRSFGAKGDASGEVVFNTCLSGYQEVLTDPSYRGQIVVMTSPHIGNYGVNVDDRESAKPWVEAFVVREASEVASNFRSSESLPDYLSRHGIVAIEGVDTRALTRKIRTTGAMTGFVSTEITDPEVLRAKVAEAPRLVGRDLVKEVTRGRRIVWTEGYTTPYSPKPARTAGAGHPQVVALDFGAKENIFRSLVEVGFRVTILPAFATSDEVMAEKPDAVFLSNGPGDPEMLDYAVRCVKGVLGSVPLFGICLGHQLLGSALGGKIVKLKFGHHGGNQPVKDLTTGKIEITSQNHGFATEKDSLARLGVDITHLNLNDGTVEGLSAPKQRAFSVQYHPEASPGPHDALHLFERFRRFVDTGGKRQ